MKSAESEMQINMIIFLFGKILFTELILKQ